MWREGQGGSPIAAHRDDIAAVVSDDRARVSAPVIMRGDIAAVADFVLKLTGILRS